MREVTLTRGLLLPALLLIGVSGCGPSYSPNTYATNAAQQANKAEQGVVIGVRQVAISASGAVGTVTGAAAGGIAGAQVGAGPVSAFSALGGSLVGGLAGSVVEHATSDTKAFEYIVRKSSGELVSVTQKDKVPLALGEKVLVIAGNQARVVPDYTIAVPGLPAKPETPTPDAKAAEAKPPNTDTKPADPKSIVAVPVDTKPAAAKVPDTPGVVVAPPPTAAPAIAVVAPSVTPAATLAASSAVPIPAIQAPPAGVTQTGPAAATAGAVTAGSTTPGVTLSTPVP